MSISKRNIIVMLVLIIGMAAIPYLGGLYAELHLEIMRP